MGLAYTLSVAAEPAQVTDALRRSAADAGLLVSGSASATGGFAIAGGTWIRVHGVKPDSDDPVRDFGFARTATAVFQLATSGDLARQDDSVVRVVTGVLDQIDADAILDVEFEIVWLVRRDGVLTVSDRDDIWTPDRLALLSRPYTRAPLAYPGEPSEEEG